MKTTYLQNCKTFFPLLNFSVAFLSSDTITFTHLVYCLSQVLTKGEGNLEWMVEERDPEYHLLPPDQLLWAGGGGLRGRRTAVAYTTSGTTAAVGATG